MRPCRMRTNIARAKWTLQADGRRRLRNADDAIAPPNILQRRHADLFTTFWIIYITKSSLSSIQAVSKWKVALYSYTALCSKETNNALTFSKQNNTLRLKKLIFSNNSNKSGPMLMFIGVMNSPLLTLASLGIVCEAENQLRCCRAEAKAATAQSNSSTKHEKGKGKGAYSC